MLNLMPTRSLSRVERPEFKAECERLIAVLASDDTDLQWSTLMAMTDPEYQQRWAGWEGLAIGTISGDIFASVLEARMQTPA